MIDMFSNPSLLPPEHLECENPWSRWTPEALEPPVLPEDLVEYWANQWKRSVKMAVRHELYGPNQTWKLPSAGERHEDTKALNEWRGAIHDMLDKGASDQEIQDAVLEATAFLGKITYDGCKMDADLFHKALNGSCTRAWCAWALAAVSVIAKRIVSDPAAHPDNKTAAHPACGLWFDEDTFATVAWSGGNKMAEKVNDLAKNMPSEWWLAMARARAHTLHTLLGRAVSVGGLMFDGDEDRPLRFLDTESFGRFLAKPSRRNPRNKNGLPCDDLLPVIIKNEKEAASLYRTNPLWRAKMARAILDEEVVNKPAGKTEERREEGVSGMASLAWIMSQPITEKEKQLQKEMPLTTQAGILFGYPNGDVLAKIMTMARPGNKEYAPWRSMWFEGCKTDEEKEKRLMALCQSVLWSLGRPRVNQWCDFIVMGLERSLGQNNAQKNKNDKGRDMGERAWKRVLWRLSSETVDPEWRTYSGSQIEKARATARDKMFLISCASAWAESGAMPMKDNREGSEKSMKMEEWKTFFRERVAEGWQPSDAAWSPHPEWVSSYPLTFTVQNNPHRMESISCNLRHFRAHFEAYVLSCIKEKATLQVDAKNKEGKLREEMKGPTTEKKRTWKGRKAELGAGAENNNEPNNKQERSRTKPKASRIF